MQSSDAPSRLACQKLEGTERRLEGGLRRFRRATAGHFSPTGRQFSNQRGELGSQLWVSAARMLGAFLLVLALGQVATGCDRKPAPDRHIKKGYALLVNDPKAAYDELGKAPNQANPKVLLGRGLALERLRKYTEAERVLLAAQGKTDERVAEFALVRVKVILGKAEEARPLVDQVVAATPFDLSAVLLEVCLANDRERAEAALAHLKQWLMLARGKKNAEPTVPAEYYVAQMSLFRQLKMHSAFLEAKKRAESAKPESPRATLALVELALKAGRRDFATLLLRELGDEVSRAEDRLRVAQLAHGMGDHQLVGQLIADLSDQDGDVLRLRAEHEFVTKQPNAELILRRTLRATKEGEEHARFWLMLAEALLRQGDTERARKETQGILKKYGDERALFLLARLDLADGKPAAALKHLTPLLDKQPAPLAAREIGAMAEVELKHFERARRLLDGILKDQPSHLRAARLRVALELDSGKSEEAARVAAGMVEQAPRQAGLHLLLAEAERSARGDAAAVASLRKSVEAIPDDARLRMALVSALEENKDDSGALAELESAHKKLSASPMLTAALATKLAKAGQTKRAVALYEALAEGTKGEPAALNNLAMLSVDELGDFERGVELAESAYRASPVPAIGDTLGWALFKRDKPGDRKRAREILESVKGQLTSPTAKYHLGAVLVASGEVKEGARLLQQALSQAEDFAEAEDARRVLENVP